MKQYKKHSTNNTKHKSIQLYMLPKQPQYKIHPNETVTI